MADDNFECYCLFPFKRPSKTFYLQPVSTPSSETYGLISLQKNFFKEMTNSFVDKSIHSFWQKLFPQSICSLLRTYSIHCSKTFGSNIVVPQTSPTIKRHFTRYPIWVLLKSVHADENCHLEKFFYFLFFFNKNFKVNCLSTGMHLFKLILVLKFSTFRPIFFQYFDLRVI